MTCQQFGQNVHIFQRVKLTMTVAARGLHYAVVLVIAHHGLVTISLATLLDVALDLHAQLTLHAAALGEDTVRPVAHRLGIVFVTRAVLGLGQRIHLVVFTLVTLFALALKEETNKQCLPHYNYSLNKDMNFFLIWLARFGQFVN